MQPAVVETEGVVVVAQTPALLVYHLRKTAGSSLERFVRENMARSAIEVELDGPRISKQGDPAETFAPTATGIARSPPSSASASVA